MKTLTLSLAFLLLAALSAQAGTTQCAATPGGSITPCGVFLLDGKPFRGIGMNYYTAFTRTIANPNDTSYRQGFKALADHDIHFVRFNAGGYFPTDYKLYLENREEWFRRMDGVVKAAEENHVGLIASLFWFHGCIPDLMHEPIDQIGNPDSKTHAFMRQYIKEFATRYKNSPAIWGYELGNEPNLLADLPNAGDNPAPIDKAFGWPTARTKRDELTQQMFERDMIAFATEVNKYDPNHRLITSGNSIPRPFALHNSLYNAWIQDSRNDYLTMILRDNPDPLNSISIHLYYECDDQYFVDKKVNLDGVVKTTMAAAAVVKKPLFIGELGAPRELGVEKEKTFHKRLIEAIVVNRVPLAAFWDFDSGIQGEWNISPNNERGYILDWICTANKQIEKQMKKEQPGKWKSFFHIH